MFVSNSENPFFYGYGECMMQNKIGEKVTRGSSPNLGFLLYNKTKAF